ncbi:response regulator transcription factor [Desulfopila sp. IMCC35008]|uniref:response regulator transcription factor n=1 Tax=Desulfopila sp. IMCC35008 TaxID=2653858 RepID=UPI0013D7A79E|nr:response regulator transcription factor [Desulfopila sp. IMCC35008]
MPGKTILVADDDAHIRDVVCFALKKAGYETVEAKNGRQALDLVESLTPDLLILDILMPELDGTEVCRQLQIRSVVPVIFLSSLDDEIEKIVGLEIGADDYIAKPFSPRELVARVKAVLRRLDRKNIPREVHPDLQWNGLRLNRERFEVTFDNRLVALTVTEFDLLEILMSAPVRVFNRDQLMNMGYRDGTVVTDRTIDSHIRKIRQKFRAAGCDPIETVRGIGYRMADRTI